MTCPERVPVRLARKQTGKGDSANPGYFVAIVLALLALFSAPAQSAASELKEQTQAAWDSYIHSACSRAEARARESSFLRINDLPERRLRVHAGETLVWREGDGHVELVRIAVHPIDHRAHEPGDLESLALCHVCLELCFHTGLQSHPCHGPVHLNSSQQIRSHPTGGKHQADSTAALTTRS